MSTSTVKQIFKFQHWQWLAAFVLVLITQQIILLDNSFIAGSAWGMSTESWLWIAVSIPILHQLYVWFIWRLELYQDTFSKLFGINKAFMLYKIGFTILFVSRLLFVIILAISNKGSLNIEPAISYLLVIIITPLSLYLFYSVKKYFSFDRAFGIDHFVKGYNEPFVKKGIFRFTDNGMYFFGFLVLYIPALMLFSKAALWAALFNHIYIWAHYFFTEKSDMKIIYKT
jgi:hypothetical protein